MSTESQEWTPDWLANFGSAENWLEQVCNSHNAALAAERQRREQEEATHERAEQREELLSNQLLSAQAAIEKIKEIVKTAPKDWFYEFNQRALYGLNDIFESVDLSPLRQHEKKIRRDEQEKSVAIL